MIWQTTRFAIDLAVPRVMGIVNVHARFIFRRRPRRRRPPGCWPSANGSCGKAPTCSTSAANPAGPAPSPSVPTWSCRASSPVLREAARLGLSDLRRHDQAGGHACRARSRCRHRQRRVGAASGRCARDRRRAPGLRRLPDAHAGHRRRTMQTDTQYERRRCRRRDVPAGAGRLARIGGHRPGPPHRRRPRHRIRQGCTAEPRVCWRGSRSFSPSAWPVLAGWSRKAGRWPVSAASRRRRLPSARRPSVRCSTRPASPRRCSPSNAAPASSASTTSRRRWPRSSVWKAALMRARTIKPEKRQQP